MFVLPKLHDQQLDDPGLKGTEWVALVPIDFKQHPQCRLLEERDQRMLARGMWSFLGLKGTLLFFLAPDGLNGAIPFQVLDRVSGNLIFRDNAGVVGEHFEFVRLGRARLAIQYRRAVAADCSIPVGGEACWNLLRKKLELPAVSPPKCSALEWLDIPADQQAKNPSAIEYKVEVGLLPRTGMRAVPAAAVKCRPAD